MSERQKRLPLQDFLLCQRLNSNTNISWLNFNRDQKEGICVTFHVCNIRRGIKRRKNIFATLFLLAILTSTCVSCTSLLCLNFIPYLLWKREKKGFLFLSSSFFHHLLSWADLIYFLSCGFNIIFDWIHPFLIENSLVVTTEATIRPWISSETLLFPSCRERSEKKINPEK